MIAVRSWWVLSIGMMASLGVGCGTEDPSAEDGSAAASGSGSVEPPDGTGGAAGGGSAVLPPIFINELVASNVSGAKDTEGGTGDWLELYNSGDEDIDLTGYFVSDNADSLTKAQLGAGLTIPAGGVLMLWSDSDVDQGVDHLPYNLSKEGEGVYVSTPNNELVDGIEWTSAPSDTSYARFPDGTGDFVWCTKPTPGLLNGDACAE